VHRALRERGRAVRHVLHGLGRSAHRVGAGHVHGLRRAAELLDPTLDLTSVSLRLLQVLLEALLVGRARGHRDVRLERGLELLLLAVRLVEVLDELQVLGL
jgi:hypothetical protein